MTGETGLQRINPDELPDLLMRLSNEHRTDLALFGPEVSLSPSMDNWPKEFQGRVVFQLTTQLSSLPLELLRLNRLQTLTFWSLSLQDTDITAIAENLQQLSSLDLSDNEVGADGARAIAENLQQLSSLNLSFNEVGDDGARAIAENLQQLSSLDLSDNEVGDDGARAIAENLQQLSSLNLSFNEVGDDGARAIAENLQQLSSLNLSNNNVGDDGARAIAENLQQLSSLNLSFNEVGDDGARAIVENLQQLSSLDLSGNKVGDDGARAIAENLQQLSSLNLRNNNVGDDGARAIAENLQQLSSLNLRNNKVGDDGARAIAENLQQLSSLNLSNNNVGDAVVIAIGQHQTALNDLHLNSNKQITTVAPLAQLPLVTLNIAETNVVDLSPLKSWVLAKRPIHWSQATWRGVGIYVEDCPLTHPSPEIVKQGPEAVLNYFHEVEAQGVDRLFEAKLLIVGEGGAGKTSILRRMFLPELGLPNEDETTRGIDIHRHEFSMSNGRKFRLNAWDFGGQQIYHATHQFFLTKRSLYVLVDDTRSDHKSVYDEGFKFWLEVVETLSAASPLLIFQNEKGGRSKQIDEVGIRGRFPNVEEFHRGNLEHPCAADKLRQAVEYYIQKLPHIGEDVPAKWVAIRDELKELAKTQPYISLDNYFTVYAGHLEADLDKALKLSQYLHDLGVFLHFQEPRELRRTIFLQNQWMTDAVFRILDDENVKSQQGRFTLDDCDRLWSKKGYADKEIELRALMVRFELCYRLPDMNKETWLVPQHLSPSKPSELDNWARSGDLMLTYRYEFLPRGLVSRLIVRVHRFVKQPNLCWLQGALFEHGETKMLVVTAEKGNEIILRSRGPEKKSLLSTIASELDALNDSFQGLKDKVSKWVPCICETCMNLTEPAMFEQKKLIERKSRGKPSIECPNPPDYHDVSVLELLDGMNLEQWLARAKQELPQDNSEIETPEESNQSKSADTVKEKTIRIFLASSAELREDRDAFDLYFRQQNDRLRKQGIYLEVIRWENFLDAMSTTRLQNEYNQKIRHCDIFVSLFKTKTGKYTEEEFDVAYKTFKKTKKPLIYTYFRKTTVSTSDVNVDDLISLRDFKDKLSNLSHFYKEYESIEGLQGHFRGQLDKLREDKRL
ncbi:COR domain-containing protein [Acaryochloris marina]|uniref:COR domain-containing protein n=1 Tax=Acaryochloris marina TaxID=155978 RepID=UPI001BB0675A|nr:COR domain-containing protein [Acaryochloris marina]QUY40769.1 hypothetical protein I1H34_15770 [Acaryochloris marina S15]